MRKNTKNKFKMLISGIAVISMAIPIIGELNAIPTLAENSTVSTDISLMTASRNLSIDYLGQGTSPAATSQGSPKFTSADEGKEFWIGVAVDNVNDLPLFTDGIYSLEIAFEYNPDFLEPYYNSSNMDDDWQTAIEAGNLSSANDSLFWNSAQYEILSSRKTTIDVINDREDLTDAINNRSDWRMCTIGVMFKDTATFTDARFQNLTDDGKQYLIKLPFILKDTPDASAADQNPLVISFVRGPATFDIGSGSDGTVNYASWEASPTDTEDQTNLRNLFNFNGDIRLFNQGAEISKIDVYKSNTPVPATPDPSATTDPSATSTPTPTSTPFPLSQSKALNEEGFSSEKYDYYISVPNDTETVQLDIMSAEMPTVTSNSAAVSVSAGSSGHYWTADISLDILNKDVSAGGEVDGYNNKLVVSGSGGSSYNIYIRRLLEPKIVLEYGNSPYGEIMRETTWTDAQKISAKDAFNTSNKYSSLYLPTNVSDKSGIRYSLNAWNNSEDPAVNMDRNDYAIFTYQRTSFRDSGFTATDSMGGLVDATNITRTISFYRLSARNISEDLSTKDPESVSVTGEPADYLFTEITDSAKGFVRPDIYEMKYTFLDPYTNELVEETRNIIVLFQRGDTNVDNSVNGTDQTAIISRVGGTPLYNATIVPVTTANLYVYRTVDTNMDGSINGTDQTAIISRVGGVPIIPFYKVIE